jgi:phosphoglycerol transferase MdoB-like AlkP superfamily enzyme
MSMKAMHAVLTLLIGSAVGIVWLRTFWHNTRRVPATVLAAPIAAGLLGLGHWVAYDFSLGHWAGDFSLLQAIFNVGVAFALFYRRGALTEVA